MAARHPDLLTVASTAGFVVDVQERFRSHIFGFDEMLAAIQLLLRGCAVVGVPLAFSEQYPGALGLTVEELSPLLEGAAQFDKMEISSCAAPNWAELPAGVRESDTFIVVGIETHVCVSQTAHDLLHMGKRVHVPADAVGSRDPWQRDIALERLARAGAVITTVEAALFELLECAGTDNFKAVQRLIKDHDAQQREAVV